MDGKRTEVGEKPKRPIDKPGPAAALANDTLVEAQAAAQVEAEKGAGKRAEDGRGRGSGHASQGKREERRSARSQTAPCVPLPDAPAAAARPHVIPASSLRRAATAFTFADDRVAQRCPIATRRIQHRVRV